MIMKFELSHCVFRFGPLVWRSNKDHKKLNKAARNAKCNSGDSGIHIEVSPSPLQPFCPGFLDTFPLLISEVPFVTLLVNCAKSLLGCGRRLKSYR